MVQPHVLELLGLLVAAATKAPCVMTVIGHT